MNFVDSNLVQIADSTSRPKYFSSDELSAIAAVAFDADGMGLGGPFTAIFDSLTFGYAISATATLDGQWGLPSAHEKTSTSLTIRGLQNQDSAYVDALWRGAIVARATTSLAPIESVALQWTDEQIDQQIITDLGALPAMPQLETERRTRLLARMKSAAHQPNAITDATIDSILTKLDVGTVSDLLAMERGAHDIGVLQVQFGQPGPVSQNPKVLPFAGAVMIRNTDFSVSQLLAQTKIVQAQLTKEGFKIPAEEWVRTLRPFTVIWVVPASTFDDTGWPGANPDQRISRATTWLAEQGIALIPKK